MKVREYDSYFTTTKRTLQQTNAVIKDLEMKILKWSVYNLYVQQTPFSATIFLFVFC